MANGDYYRPAEYQINKHYVCKRCGDEREVNSYYSVGKCHCGGYYSCTGESYPSSHNDWDEAKDRNGNWYNRNDRY